MTLEIFTHWLCTASSSVPFLASFLAAQHTRSLALRMRNPCWILCLPYGPVVCNALLLCLLRNGAYINDKKDQWELKATILLGLSN